MLLDEVFPDQYDSAKKENPDIKTSVKTAGGNDILLNPLADPPSTIAKEAVRLTDLWNEMAKDGVLDVVYIMYSEGGANGDNVKTGIEKIKPICDGLTSLRCHYMLSDPFIHMQLFQGDGLNV